MPTSDPAIGKVVRVPFPYTDAETRQRRPALVVAAAGGDGTPRLLWVLMITSAAHRGWPGDIDIPDLAGAGLPVPSVIRTAKIATIDTDRATALGDIDTTTLTAVRATLAHHLALTA